MSSIKKWTHSIQEEVLATTTVKLLKQNHMYLYSVSHNYPAVILEADFVIEEFNWFFLKFIYLLPMTTLPQLWPIDQSKLYVRNQPTMLF